MPGLTTEEQISIGALCALYSANENASGVKHGGNIDPELPTKIFLVNQGLKWLYELDPTNDDLTIIGNYLISICRHQFRAQATLDLNNGGTVSPIVPDEGEIYPFIITGADFEPDGVTYNNPLIVGDEYMIFITGYNQEWQFAGSAFEYTATGFEITISDFDANNFGNIIVQDVH